MMKLIIISIFLLALNTSVDIYSLQFPELTGKQISMSSYRKKKIIVTVFNARSPDLGYLKYLHQLQARWPGVQIIAVPALDFAGLDNVQKLGTVKTSEKINLLVTRASFVKKSSSQQHPLMSWVTNKDQNGHFDDDIEMTEKLFFISETGVLYGSLDKSASPELILKTLGQKIN